MRDTLYFLQIRPKNDEDRIPTPSPEPSPKPKKKTSSTPSRSRGGGRHPYPRIPSDVSLTTITEEPSQYSSHEIVVEPEVVVETTTIPTKHGSICSSDENSRGDTPPASVPSTPQSHHITRVKATATVKVEVHTPIPGNTRTKKIFHKHRQLLFKIRSMIKYIFFH